MSTVARPHRSLIALPRRVWALRHLAHRAQEQDLLGAGAPTTTVRRMLLTVATSLLLAVVLDAHGIVHSGQGMQDGPMRDVTLAVGGAALWVAEASHLDWPWLTLHAALGYTGQPSLAPLLASGVPDGNSSHTGGGAVLGGVQPPSGNGITPVGSPTATASPAYTPTATASPAYTPTATASPAYTPTVTARPAYTSTETASLAYTPTVTTSPVQAVAVVTVLRASHRAAARRVAVQRSPTAVVPPARDRAVMRAEARGASVAQQKGARMPDPAIDDKRLIRASGRTVTARAVASSSLSQPVPRRHTRSARHVRGGRPYPVQVVVTAANTAAAIAKPLAVFHLGVPRVYCWVRNSTLSAQSTTLTFRWVDVSTGRVLDQFPVTRSSWTYTGAYDRAVTGALGTYRCEVRAGDALLGSARFAISLPPLRVPTARHPLRLLVTGDSLTGYLGPVLVQDAASVGPVKGYVDTHNGTGLTRPDFVDWSLVARQQVAQDNPDAVVVMIGGNDFQNMTLPDGQFFQAGTPAWTREYERRAAICMRIWAQGGTRRVYWLSMPPARNASWAYDDNQINVALQRAAKEVPGAVYLNVLGPVTNHGKYTDYVYDGHGQPILIREPDGVHLNLEGSSIVAQEVLPVLAHDWHLR